MEQSSPEEEEEYGYYERDQMGAVERRCVAGGERLLRFLEICVSWMVWLSVGKGYLLEPWWYYRLRAPDCGGWGRCRRKAGSSRTRRKEDTEEVYLPR